MNSPLVTVIVPIYNVAGYLAECLNSLVRQTLKQIEIIMVNDGSTDNSEAIAKTYSGKYENFKLISGENRGLSAARNIGLEVASGEYVYFLDSDDFIADNAIEKLYDKASKDKLDQLRFVAYTFIDGTHDYAWSRRGAGNAGGRKGYKYTGEYPGTYTGLEFYQLAMSNGDYYPNCCLIFTRRSVIEDNHLRFHEGIIFGDNLFNFELTTLCQRVALLHEPLYYRRYRSGSITNGGVDLIARCRSCCINVEEVDKFIEVHSQVKGKASEWQIVRMINEMIRQWEQMTPSERESQEVRECFARVRLLQKKYGNGITKYAKIFFISPSLYKMCRWLYSLRRSLQLILRLNS